MINNNDKSLSKTISSNNNNSEIKNNNISSSTNTVMDNPIIFQLIEFGIDPVYSKRLILYNHPRDIDDALDYLSTKNGIIQHYYVKRKNNNIKENDNKSCYLCGEPIIKHLGFIPSNNNQIIEDNNKENINISSNIFDNSIDLKSKKENISINSESKIECQICNEYFISDDNNTLKKCGHSFCNDCWNTFLSTKIQENKLTTINA